MGQTSEGLLQCAMPRLLTGFGDGGGGEQQNERARFETRRLELRGGGQREVVGVFGDVHCRRGDCFAIERTAC